MIEIIPVMTYTNWPFQPGQSPKQQRARIRSWLRKGMKAAAAMWSKDILPLHFSKKAYNRYGSVYFRRKVSTARLRKGGGRGSLAGLNLPLVDSGQLKREVTRSARRPTSRASEGGPVRVTIPLRTSKNFIKFHGRNKVNANWQQYKKELEAITEDEQRQMAAVMDRTIQKEIDNFRDRTIRRLKRGRR